MPDAKTVVTAETPQRRSALDEQREGPVRLGAVRQAVAYSIDRDAIVKKLFGDLGVTRPSRPLQPADRRGVRGPAGVVAATR